MLMPCVYTETHWKTILHHLHRPSSSFLSVFTLNKICDFTGTARSTIKCQHLQRRILHRSLRDERARAEDKMDHPESSTVWMQILELGVFRFDSSEKAREEAWPSLSFADPNQRDTPFESSGGKDNATPPHFLPCCSLLQGTQTMSIQLPAGTSFYGTGEVSGPLERTGQRIFTWNSDAWGYGPSTTSLYQSHPWVLAVLPDGKALGVLAETTQRCEVDLRKESTIKIIAKAPFPLITFGPFASPAIVLSTLSHAIGTIGMPPKWSLGYHQCRWSYEPDKKVLEIAKEFRKRQIPCDVLWMDIDYMDGFRCFTFDPDKFSSPSGLVKDLHSDGFKAVWMLDPGIKAEGGYFVYDSGCLKDVWILSSNRNAYVGEVWPGPCVFPDFTSSKTRRWWAGLVRKFVPIGVDGIWNDMNEPTVFKTVTKTMPNTNIHNADAEIGGPQTHSHYHNVYGMLMARSTYEGMLLANATKRPFVLTRAGYIGSQRYAATWTGDNLSTWEHLSMSIPMALNMGLSGQPFAGPDIGGFAGDATPKLFARWMGIGALLPFSRAHSEKGTLDHEPWSFGTECENVCRLALARRYRLLPHMYTLFYSAHTKGEPVISPLFFADTIDPKLRKVEDSFLLGPVLVSASVDKQVGAASKKTILPSRIWHEFDFEDSHEDLPLLFLKGGSIIPLAPVVQNTGELHASNDLTLIVALDEHDHAEGLLYEDDGDGFEYQRGKYLLTSYEASLRDGELLVKTGWSKGDLQRPQRSLDIHLLLGDTAKVVFSGTDAETVKFKMPTASEIAELVEQARKKKNSMGGKLSDNKEIQDPLKGVGAPRALVELKGGDWKLKVIPWIGGRILSMVHSPTGIEWLWSRMEMSGYEEYGGTEYRSAGCAEEYNIVKQDIVQISGDESVEVEGDILGGLVMYRKISISRDLPQLLQIESTLVAKSSFAGAGGFSRVACLRVHPTFQLRHPMDTMVVFTSVDGNAHAIGPGSEECFLRGDQRPKGEWMLVDSCANVSLVNRFNLEEVEQCSICWGPGTCNLELWSPERPVSKATPINVRHTYETIY